MPALQQQNFLTAIVKKAAALFARSEIKQSQAWYRMKRERAVQHELHQDIVGTLPVEEKLRLGMYRFMD
jgi:hypothetical protein